MKTVFIVLSLFIPALLTLDKIGVTPIAPGPESHFRGTVDPAIPGLWRFNSDKGRLLCCVDLSFRGLSDRATPTARLTNGVELGIREMRQVAGVTTLRLALPAKGPDSAGLFEWPPAESIELRFVEPPSASGLADWTLYLSDGEADTLSKQRWRRWWFWISLVAWIVSIPIAFFVGSKRNDAHLGDAAYRCTVEIIDGIEGANKRETTQQRIILRKICLEGSTRKEAVDATGLRTPSERGRAWGRARANFEKKLQTLIIALSAKTDRFKVSDG